MSKNKSGRKSKEIELEGIHQVPLYLNTFHVFATNVMIKSLKRVEWTTCNPEDHKDSRAVTCSRRPRKHIIFLNLDYGVTNDTISHECLHAAWDIMNNVGFAPSYDQHEPLAYLMGWLTQKTHDDLKKWGIKVK